MKKMNKTISTVEIVNYVRFHGLEQPCIKLAISNVVFPKWNNQGLFGEIFCQKVRTKEQPTGCDYSETRFQTVMRILGGKVFMNGRPDTYAWPFEKVEKIKDKMPIGIGSPEGMVNWAKLAQTITDPDEKLLVADMFCSTTKDFILANTPAEKRVCFYVSEELYNLGLKEIVDEWMECDSEGMSATTKVYPGDFVIISSDNGIYRIGADEFHETHVLVTDSDESK